MPRFSVELVEAVSDVAAIIDNLHGLSTSQPSLYIDLEGVELVRDGTVSFLQIYVKRLAKVYILDVHTLGKTAFETPGSCITTLRCNLESPDIGKVFFDCRNDSDALYPHLDIALRSVIDIQLMEIAARSAGKSKNRLIGLRGALEPKECGPSKAKRLAYQAIKRNGKQIPDENEGGSCEVFNIRPLCKAIIDQSAQDVALLLILWRNCNAKIAEEQGGRGDEEAD